MGNIIKIKHGSSIPTTTELANGYELGFSTSADCLYINNGTSITRIGIKVLTGTSAPASGAGQNDDLYVQYSETGDVITINAVYVKISGSWIALPSGGGGASVYIGTTDPSPSVGVDGNLYVKYHLDNNDPIVDTFYVKISGTWASVSTSGGATYLELTQQQYDLLTPAQKTNGTIYFVTDAGWGNHTLSGTSDPSSGFGENGDLYFKTETVNNDTSIVGMYVKLGGAWLEVSVGPGPTPTTSKFRYLAWVATDTKTHDARYISVGALKILDALGNLITFPSGTTFTPNIDNGYTISSLFTGATNIEWSVDANSTVGLPIRLSILIDFGANESDWFDINTYTSFARYFPNNTAYNATKDVVSWRLEVFNEGETHIIVASNTDCATEHTAQGLADLTAIALPS